MCRSLIPLPLARWPHQSSTQRQPDDNDDDNYDLYHHDNNDYYDDDLDDGADGYDNDEVLYLLPSDDVRAVELACLHGIGLLRVDLERHHQDRRVDEEQEKSQGPHVERVS